MADYSGLWRIIKFARKAFLCPPEKNIFQLFFLLEKSWRTQADYNFGGFRRTLADIC